MSDPGCSRCNTVLFIARSGTRVPISGKEQESKELPVLIDRSFSAPDFIAKGPLGEFFVEATTVNPPLDAQGQTLPLPKVQTPEEKLDYVRD